MERINELLDRLAFCIVLGIGIFVGLIVSLVLGYIMVKSMGLFNSVLVCVGMWAFMRVMPNDCCY